MSNKFISFLITFTLIISSQSVAADVETLGQIEPTNGIASIVSPQGTITEIKVVLGDVVTKGFTLAILKGNSISQVPLDEKAIEIQKLKVQIAEEDAKRGENKLERMGKMGGEKFSKSLMEQREYESKTTKINLNIAKQELERLKIKHEMSVKTDQNIIIEAPINGTVLDILQNVGDSGGQVIIRMANLDSMSVNAEVFEGDLLKIDKGMEATINSDSLPAPAKGKVVFIGKLIADQTKIAKVKILLDDPKVASRLINLEVSVLLSTGN